MESLDRGFLAMSSVLVVLLLSLNRSRSPCPDPELAPVAGACVGVLAALLELTWREGKDPEDAVTGVGDDLIHLMF